jgi:NADH-quinone oxidoreductase subunit C
MPDAPGLELIAQELNEAHADAVLETYHDRDQACLMVDPEQVLAVLGWLRDTPKQEYRFLASLHAVDYLPAEPRFGVHYELLNMPRVERIRVRAALPDPAAPRGGSSMEKPEATAEGEVFRAGAEEAAGLPVIDSCVELFPTAEFQEREAYDFFGIVFRNHPDLRRILMPEEYVGWPLRRDFPIGGEPVIFTHNEREVPRWTE